MSSRFGFSFVRALTIAASFALLGVWPSAASAQSYPPAWSSGSSYAIGDQAQLNGNVIRAIHAVTPGGFKYGEWELWDVRANTNVIIGTGQTFASLTAAWTFVENARVAQGAYLHLLISSAHGQFLDKMPSSFSLNHPFGANISILGDSPPNCILNFTGPGLTLDSGHSIGAISNLLFAGNEIGAGIQLKGNASIKTASNLQINFFDTGIDSEQGSSIYCDNKVAITNFGTGVSAVSNGSVVFQDGATFNDANAIGSTGLYEAFGGYIQARFSTITDCGYGVLATQGGVVNIENAQISHNQTGIYVTMRGHVDCENAVFLKAANADIHNDIDCITAGTVDATGSTTGLTNVVGAGDGSYIFGT